MILYLVSLALKVSTHSIHTELGPDLHIKEGPANHSRIKCSNLKANVCLKLVKVGWEGAVNLRLHLFFHL